MKKWILKTLVAIILCDFVEAKISPGNFKKRFRDIREIDNSVVKNVTCDSSSMYLTIESDIPNSIIYYWTNKWEVLTECTSNPCTLSVQNMTNIVTTYGLGRVLSPDAVGFAYYVEQDFLLVSRSRRVNFETYCYYSVSSITPSPKPNNAYYLAANEHFTSTLKSANGIDPVKVGVSVGESLTLSISANADGDTYDILPYGCYWASNPRKPAPNDPAVFIGNQCPYSPQTSHNITFAVTEFNDSHVGYVVCEIAFCLDFNAEECDGSCTTNATTPPNLVRGWQVLHQVRIYDISKTTTTSDVASTAQSSENITESTTEQHTSGHVTKSTSEQSSIPTTESTASSTSAQSTTDYTTELPSSDKSTSEQSTSEQVTTKYTTERSTAEPTTEVTDKSTSEQSTAAYTTEHASSDTTTTERSTSAQVTTEHTTERSTANPTTELTSDHSSVHTTEATSGSTSAQVTTEVTTESTSEQPSVHTTESTAGSTSEQSSTEQQTTTVQFTTELPTEITTDLTSEQSTVHITESTAGSTSQQYTTDYSTDLPSSTMEQSTSGQVTTDHTTERSTAEPSTESTASPTTAKTTEHYTSDQTSTERSTSNPTTELTSEYSTVETTSERSSSTFTTDQTTAEFTTGHPTSEQSTTKITSESTTEFTTELPSSESTTAMSTPQSTSTETTTSDLPQNITESTQSTASASTTTSASSDKPTTTTPQPTTTTTGSRPKTICSGRGTCRCKTGFTGPDCSQEVDWCKEKTVEIDGHPVVQLVCGDRGTCISTPTGAQCVCKNGFTGQFCDQLMSDQLFLSQRCVAYNSSAGYAEDYSPHDQTGCHSGQECVPDDMQCLLTPCDNPIGWCLPNQRFPVHTTAGPVRATQMPTHLSEHDWRIAMDNDEECSIHGECQCDPGFTGEDCETEIDWCDQPVQGFNQTASIRSTCGQNGTCISQSSGASCVCQPGFTGQFCHEPIPNQVYISRRCYAYPPRTHMLANTPIPVGCGPHNACVPDNLQCLLAHCKNAIGWCLPLVEVDHVTFKTLLTKVTKMIWKFGYFQ